jgi:hypothetical protein
MYVGFTVLPRRRVADPWIEWPVSLERVVVHHAFGD